MTGWGQTAGRSMSPTYFHPDRAPSRQQLSTATYGTDGPLWIGRVARSEPVDEVFLDACGEANLTQLHEMNEPDTPDMRRLRSPSHRGRRWSEADAYLHPVARART